MPLEYVCAVEALLCGAATAGAKATDHGTLVVGEGVSVLVVLSCEALGMVFTGWDWTLLWSLILVGKHVSLQVFDVSAACCNGAETLV